MNPPVDFNTLTIGNVISFVTGTGIIAGFMYKIFSLFNQVKKNEISVQRCHERIDNLKASSENQKSELIDKVEQTNDAVNLLCSAVSALIDDSLLDNNESKQQLREIKHKLDNKKEII